MNTKQLIYNATIINEGETFVGSVLINGDKIESIFKGDIPADIKENTKLIDATNKWLIPGVIDDQVHFREPGLIQKAEIKTEAKAAVAGGTTSYMEMPNTNPQTTTIEALEEKYTRASKVSLANYSFYMGATNDNLAELKKVDSSKICGVKVFMGSSTGNMLVDKENTLKGIFSEVKSLIATHCEDEATIIANRDKYSEAFNGDVPLKYHPLIRSAEACYTSSSFAVGLAKKYGTRLHILHISTEKELALFSDEEFTNSKKITAEVCVHHLMFSDKDYETKGGLIKWNPAVKSEADKNALLEGLKQNKLDVIATDHAPHLEEEKHGNALTAMSGGPMVQHSLLSMLEFAKQDKLSLPFIIEKMCHAPAKLYAVKDRGYIREGYAADLVIIDPNKEHLVTKESLHYKCGWSPLEGTLFSTSIDSTFVNGHRVYHDGAFNEDRVGQRLSFIPYEERF